MAAQAPQTAVYDEYLESKMRSILEALMEGVLTMKPDNVEGFCVDWLMQWQQDNDPEQATLQGLRAERDLSLNRRDALLAQLSRLEEEAGVGVGAPPGQAEAEPDVKLTAEAEAEPDVKLTAEALAASGLQGEEEPTERRDQRVGTKESRYSAVSYAASGQGKVLSRPVTDDGQAGTGRWGVSSRDARRKDTIASVASNDEEIVISAAEEAKEQEKIRRMQEKTRRPGVSAQAISEDRVMSWTKPVYEKEPEVRQRLKAIIDGSEKLQVLFGHLPAEQLWSVIDAMFPKEAEAGDVIITQGEEGDNFYIVDEGTLDAFVQRGDAEPSKVCEYESGGMFGELALMYNANRAATVKASSHVKLWALDRESFQMMLMTAENTRAKTYESFLESIDILQDLTKYEIARLSDMLRVEVFDNNEVIINQGDAGNYFYILESGEAKAYIGGEQGELEVKHYTEPGAYFGEIALLKSATRKATVKGAGEGCSVLSVSRQDFDTVLGPIKDHLGKNIDKYPQYKDALREMVEDDEQEKVEKAKIKQMKVADRRPGVSAPAISEERMKAWKKPYYEKPPEVRDKIKAIIGENDKLQVLFGHLTDDAVYSVIDAMNEQVVEKGSNVITQGEEGDNFYIVDEGTFDVFVQRGDQAPGKVLEYGPGAMFGELALMYNAPRAATVTATSQAKVFALDRESFQLMLTTAENTKKAQYEEFLAGIELFQALTRYELARLSDMLESELFDSGEDIVSQGDTGSYFYILEDGTARAFINGESGEVEVKQYNAPGEFFGEVALITDCARKATVRAGVEGCCVLSVSREDFDRVLGPIREIMKANIDKYPAYADIIQEMGSTAGGSTAGQ